MDASETNHADSEAPARVHAAQNTGYYDADASIAGRDAVPDRWLGDVSGMDAMHLECHLAYDAISLVRRGARVTGAAAQVRRGLRVGDEVLPVLYTLLAHR